MTGLDALIDGYLASRRALGCSLERPEKVLREFAAWMDGRGKTVVTVADTLEWACLPTAGGGPEPITRAPGRVEAVRGFAVWLRSVDPAHEAPPPGALPSRWRRPTPVILSAAETAALIEAAASLRPGHRAGTYPVLFGLLASTGLRIGEARGLRQGQADLDAGVLTIESPKTLTARLVPIRPSVADALRRYAAWRGATLAPDDADAPFFAGPRGGQLKYGPVWHAFHQAASTAGLEGPGRELKIHHLRHRFAVSTLLAWCRDGGDVEARCQRSRNSPLVASRYSPGVCPGLRVSGSCCRRGTRPKAAPLGGGRGGASFVCLRPGRARRPGVCFLVGD
jgi:integrase